MKPGSFLTTKSPTTGHQISMNSEPSLKVFVSQFPLGWDESQLRDYFSSYGQISTVKLFRNQGKSNPQADLGCAYVTFERKSEGEETIHKLTSLPDSFIIRWADGEVERLNSLETPYATQPPYTLTSEKVYVEYASPDGRPYYWDSTTNTSQWERPQDGQIIKQVADAQANPYEQQAVGNSNLFIFHLPTDWSDQDLLSYFAPYGNIVSYRIMTDKVTGRNRGFGFVSYDNPISAQMAMKHMNGFQVLGKRLKVQLKKRS